jgi:hypothetical protein
MKLRSSELQGLRVFLFICFSHTSQEIQKVNQQQIYPGKQPHENHYRALLEKHLAKTTQSGEERVLSCFFIFCS